MDKQAGPVRVDKRRLTFDGWVWSMGDEQCAAELAAAINDAIEAAEQRVPDSWAESTTELVSLERRKAFDEAIACLCRKPGCLNDAYANDIRRKLEQLKGENNATG